MNGSSSTAKAVATPAAVLAFSGEKKNSVARPDLEHAVGRLAHEPDGEQLAEVLQRPEGLEVVDHLHRVILAPGVDAFRRRPRDRWTLDPNLPCAWVV